MRSCGASSAVYTAKLAGEPEYGCGRGTRLQATAASRAQHAARASPRLHVHAPRRGVQAEGGEGAGAADVLHLAGVAMAPQASAPRAPPRNAARPHLVDDLVAAVVARAGQALAVLVGERRAQRLHHRSRREVLGRNQLDASAERGAAGARVTRAKERGGWRARRTTAAPSPAAPSPKSPCPCLSGSSARPERRPASRRCAPRLPLPWRKHKGLCPAGPRSLRVTHSTPAHTANSHRS